MNKSNLKPIEQRVQTHLKACFTDVETPRLVMGVSGGADSMSLLHILHKLGAQLMVVHINYQTRGRASHRDAQLVKKTADTLGVDCKIVTAEPEEAEDLNFQQWAREVRYQAFEAEATRTGAEGIATAHHRDDQIETILQKIFRGAGLAAWSAMEVWNGRLFRPLLEVHRQQIEAYCKSRSISYRDDESNFSSDYARNFLRNDWLAQLERHFPGWQKNVLRVAGQATVFEEALDFIFQHITDDKGRMRRDAFLKLGDGLQKSVLVHWLTQLDESVEISRDALGELAKLKDLQTGKSLQLTGLLRLMRDRNYFKLMQNVTENPSGFTLQKSDLADSGLVFDHFVMQLGMFEGPDFDTKLYLDAAKMAWPLQLRRWRAGDRFRPFGMNGHQPVAEHLTNRKVSAADKNRAFVIESFEETICAVIFPPIENRRSPGTISEAVKCCSSTDKCLIIEMNE